MGVRIPKVFAQGAKLKDGDVVEVQLKHGRLVIMPARPAYTLEQLLSGITSENKHGEVTTGKKRGKEAW